MSDYECIKCHQLRHCSDLDNNLVCTFCLESHIESLIEQGQER